MSTKNVAKILALLKDETGDYETISKSLATALKATTVEEICSLLEKAAKGKTVESLGFGIIQFIFRRADNDGKLQLALIELVLKKKLEKNLREALLDTMDKVVRKTKKKKIRNAYYKMLRKIATNAYEQQAQIRAIRALNFSTDKETIDTIQSLIPSKDLKLMNAVARTARVWHKKEVQGSKKIVASLATFAAKNIKKLPYLPSLYALALENDQTGTLISKLIQKANVSDCQRILALSGGKLKEEHLAEIIEKVRKKPTAEGDDTIRGIIYSDTSIPRRLYSKKFFRAYLHTCKLTPDIENTGAGKKRIKSLIEMSDSTIRKDLSRILMADEYFNDITSMLEASTISWECVSTGNCTNAQGYFTTGLQKGDAIYRDLDVSIIANHWHAGLFEGFRAFDTRRVKLIGQHINKDIGEGENLVKTFFVSKDFSSPNIDLSLEMQSLLDEFKLEFAGGNSDLSFRAIKTTPGITLAERYQVMSTTGVLAAYDFGYTAFDMMDYCWFGWDGSYDDIDEMRCDGLVEFAYEKNNLEVSHGSNPDLWKISKGGKKYPENHNDVHNWPGSSGELCPKIQSGVEGSVSKFITPVHEAPIVDFMKVCYKGKHKDITIEFNVTVRMSSIVYTRILVRKTTHNAKKILRSVTSGSMPGGKDWTLHMAWANNLERISWDGKTADGNTFKGQDGDYEFRIQVIDEGGNVSNEVCRTLTIKW